MGHRSLSSISTASINSSIGAVNMHAASNKSSLCWGETKKKISALEDEVMGLDKPGKLLNQFSSS